MDAHGGLLYMVAYNLRKVENRDRYPDPPLNCRYSIGAVPRLVAPVAPVRFRVVASLSSRLAQLVERKTLNLVVVGSSPTVGVYLFVFPLRSFANSCV